MWHRPVFQSIRCDAPAHWTVIVRKYYRALRLRSLALADLQLDRETVKQLHKLLTAVREDVKYTNGFRPIPFQSLFVYTDR